MELRRSPRKRTPSARQEERAAAIARAHESLVTKNVKDSSVTGPTSSLHRQGGHSSVVSLASGPIARRSRTVSPVKARKATSCNLRTVSFAPEVVMVDAPVYPSDHDLPSRLASIPSSFGYQALKVAPNRPAQGATRPDSIRSQGKPQHGHCDIVPPARPSHALLREKLRIKLVLEPMPNPALFDERAPAQNPIRETSDVQESNSKQGVGRLANEMLQGKALSVLPPSFFQRIWDHLGWRTKPITSKVDVKNITTCQHGSCST